MAVIQLTVLKVGMWMHYGSAEVVLVFNF